MTHRTRDKALGTVRKVGSLVHTSTEQQDGELQ